MNRPTRAPRPGSAPELLWIHRLLWVYLGLLLFEGALRKWIVPPLSTPLLIVRDPVAIAIYVLAFRAGVFPRNYFLLFGVWLSFLSLAAGLAASGGAFGVALYGWRTNFLHLPLVFVMARVWTVVQVRDVGRVVLLIAPAMALLMALQFRAGPGSFLNAGAGEGAGQIISAMGKVRPSGTFSFISGPMCFFSLVAAFLLQAQLSRRAVSPPLAVAAGCATLLALAVSGSRAMLASVGLVVAFAFVAGVVLQPLLVFRWLWGAAVAAVVAVAMSDVIFVQEGLQVFAARIESASEIEGGASGLATRAANDYVGAWPLLFEAPLLGYGLGLGTNAGAALATGQVQFLLAEGEWARVLLESGPLLGGAFLAWRLCLAAWLVWHAAAHARRRHPLPLMLFGACAIILINGGFGQPTTLGFTAFVAGLCLCSMRPAPLPARAARSSSSEMGALASAPDAIPAAP